MDVRSARRSLLRRMMLPRETQVIPASRPRRQMISMVHRYFPLPEHLGTANRLIRGSSIVLVRAIYFFFAPLFINFPCSIEEPNTRLPRGSRARP